jgi:hypothetical protein
VKLIHHEVVLSDGTSFDFEPEIVAALLETNLIQKCTAHQGREHYHVTDDHNWDDVMHVAACVIELRTYH